MHKLLKYLLLSSAIFVCAQAQAVPVLAITTTESDVVLTPGGSKDIVFTVKNNMDQNLAVTNVKPFSNMYRLKSSIKTNDCTAALAKDSSCTVTATATIEAPSTATKESGYFDIAVCIYNGVNCSASKSKLKVTIDPVNPAPLPDTLSSGINDLALSVKDTGTNAALTGKSRTTTITNTGAEAIANLVVTAADLPTGTTAADDCPSSLAGGAFCTITITPGATASSDATPTPCTATGTIPVASTITVSADNATAININAVVLGYGCIWQEGYIYSIDDSTAATGSIGGKVVALEDQKTRYLNGVVWSSNGTDGTTSSVANDSIYGVDETSTLSSASPSTGDVAGQSACDGRTDGMCNMDNIVTFYSSPNKTTAVPKEYYAAGVCDAYNSDAHQDWYLPAICEMGPASNGSGCHGTTQNIVTNLTGLLGSSSTNCTFTTNCLTGAYWSSTEYSGVPLSNAWSQYFSSGCSQDYRRKDVQLGVRCSRALSL